jgi:AcrR family transcriptional regulator/predicted DNA-binding transcriptional regulator AlpA
VTEDSRYTIRELVEKTGVPAASIHHYRSEGLLPPPERVGSRRFRYSDRHVQALRLIRLLRERRRLPLHAIRDVLPELLAGGDEQAFHTQTWDDVVTGRTEASDAARDRIVAAAVELFAARGYAGVAVNDVAAEAGVAKGSLYRHFESKDALFAAAVESVVARVVDGVASEAERIAGAAGVEAGGLLEPKAAIPALLASAWPGVMILLDLAAGSLRNQPGQRALADAALGRFVDGVGPLLAGPGSPRERAIALIVQLSHETMRAVLGSD